MKIDNKKLQEKLNENLGKLFSYCMEWKRRVLYNPYRGIIKLA